MNSRVITSRQPLQWIRGIPLQRNIAENLENVEMIQAQPDDLLICTYPKSGTTWLSEILDMIYKNGDMQACRRDTIANRVPFLEWSIVGEPTGVEQLEMMPPPRLIKTHLPVQLIPETFWENNCKVIYMARNAKDVAVSLFYFTHMIEMHPDPGTWEEFPEKFMSGEVIYGSWYDHVKGWKAKVEHHPILYLFYEDMKEDPGREIQKILRFVEKDLSKEIVEKIIRLTSFQEMKNNPMTNLRTGGFNIDQSVHSFMRKGITGDWKNHFTVAEKETFDKDYESKMAESGLRFRTQI